MMLNPEHYPYQHPQGESFYKSLGFDKQETARISGLFEKRLIKGLYRLSSDEGDQDILTILPSLEINPEIGLIDEEADFLIVALSKLKGIEDIINLNACKYIDEERLGFGPRINHTPTLISDLAKNISCTKTIIPLVSNKERSELTKEVYSLQRFSSEVYPNRTIQINYSLSWPNVTLPPKNS